MFGLFKKFGSQSKNTTAEWEYKEEHGDLLKTVLKEFASIAEERGEEISGRALKEIGIKFLALYQMSGPDFTKEHLRYELQRYRQHGLREEYKD